MTSRRRSLEWPTVLVGVAIAAGYFAVTTWHRRLPTAVFIAALAVLSAWHGSLQHELVHGHLARRRFVRLAIAMPTMNLWLPYLSYEESHLRHHRDDHLTDPTDDPESWYRTAENWDRCHAVLRAVLWCNRTLLGRLLLGPALAIGGYARAEFATLRRPALHRATFRTWSTHVPMVIITVLWLRHCDVIWWQYGLGSIYGGSSITLFRSFAEHRWMPDGQSKTAVVRTNALISLLYLNNNLHLAHHLWAGTPWYRLPSVARELRIDDLAAAGSGSYRSYGEVIRRFLLRPFCQPVHPPGIGTMLVPAPWGPEPSRRTT
jgi:fatty acid desaturase